MRTPRIVIAINVLKDSEIQFVKRMIGSAVGFFLLQIFEKTFADSIVKRVSLFGKGLDYIQGIQKPTESRGSILSPPVRVEQEAIGSMSALISLSESCYNKMDIRFAGQIPGDHFSREEVNDNA